MNIILHDDTIKKLSKFIILENKNQAVNFLKEKGLDPNTNEKGRRALDDILNITRGDGYTHILTRFYVNEKFPLDELQSLHQYLKTNNKLLLRLPKNVVDYKYYNDLKRDIDDIEREQQLKKTYNEFPAKLKSQFTGLSEQEKNHLKDLSVKLNTLPKEHKTYVFGKISRYNNIHEYIKYLEVYLISIENGNDYITIKDKILSTEGAILTYDNPDKNILISHVTSYSASKELGCTSSWCISKDANYWRSYKKGGNYYFFIWNFNYPPHDNRSMIGTAYNINKPESSQTHYKDDSRAILFDVLNNLEINNDVFTNYITKYKEDMLSSSKGGFVEALKNFNRTDENNSPLVEIIKNSNFIKENSNPEDVELYDNNINLGIQGDNLCEALEINVDEYDYVNGYTNYYKPNFYIDRDELNYIRGYLNSDNINLLKQLAMLLGEKKEVYDKFENEDGVINDFLSKFELEELSDIFLSEVEDARGTAIQNEAIDIMSKIPIDIDSGSVNTSTMIDYITNNNINPDTFDEFIEHVKENMPGLGYEALDDVAYQNADYDQLNSNMNNKLDDYIWDIENSPDEEISKKAEFWRKTGGFLEKLGFNYSIYSDALSYVRPNKIITLHNSYLDDETHEPMGVFSVAHDPEYYSSEGIEKPKDKKIRIPFNKIKNYLDQYEIPYVESKLSLINVLTESITKSELQDFLTDFGFFITLNLVHIGKKAKDENSRIEISKMSRSINGPIINGKSYGEIMSDINKWINKPLMVSAMLTKVREMLIYMKPRIKNFIEDGETKSVWIDKITKFETRYTDIIKKVSE